MNEELGDALRVSILAFIAIVFVIHLSSTLYVIKKRGKIVRKGRYIGFIILNIVLSVFALFLLTGAVFKFYNYFTKK